MALTRINTEIAGSFLQPVLGGTVNIIADPGIDWLKVGMTVQIPNGGIYEIMSNSGFVYNLKLETAIALPGQVVSANVIYPVSDNNAATMWGGANGKEW